MDRNMITTAWEQHCADGWPRFSSPHQGQLMTIDTVISGCVVYYLDSSDGLDDQRIAIVKDCLGDLDELTEGLDPQSQIYFYRLRELGAMLLDAKPQS
ncbi:MAG: hypothetical protein A4E19_07100 [Nitrospira sp. SG-bin1]|nr:MAG: hypothetical protein A4E19_07100 [Nitrospira sp. SG-bin1]